MMIYTIKNECLTIKVNSLGSELISAKDIGGSEYIYQPSDLWIGQAKNLFPNVGMVKDDYIVAGGREYPLMKHGFAKDCEFELLNITKNTLSMILRSSPYTKKHFPYSFEFIIHFSLSENTINQTYEVRNTDRGTIYFGVGAHTGFYICSDSFLDFGTNREILEIERLNMSFLTGKKKPFELRKNTLQLDEHTFDNGGFILDGWKDYKLCLGSSKRNDSVIVDFEGFNYLTLWSMPNSSEFICIEPWCGLPDFDNTEHFFEKKEGNVELEKGELFRVTQKFTLGD
jgi:galactose mutarotase-like enzyme